MVIIMAVVFVLLIEALLFVYYKVEINHEYTNSYERYQDKEVLTTLHKDKNSFYVSWKKSNQQISTQEAKG